MRRLRLVGVGLTVLGSLGFAQSDARPRLKPITASIRHAGVYHVATGKWARGASLASLVGPDVIFNNTCAPVYFVGLLACDRYQHRDRIPSTTSPTADSLFYGTSNPAHRWDSRPGCQDEYVINGFQVGYCSSHVGAVDWEYKFASSYTSCGAGDLIPQYTILVTGLPGGSTTGSQYCWTIDIDVSSLPGGGFALSADGDGVYNGGAGDTFGWSFGVTTAVTAADYTGPIIAGDVSWTGGPTAGPLAPCTGTDGTIWDRPIDLSEAGTGMGSTNFFRSTLVPAPNCCVDCYPGCYYFGGSPHADFYLKLYSDAGCPETAFTGFCYPGSGNVRACPCGNPPASGSVGCDNFGPNPPGGTGGAQLASTGLASIADDSLQFQATGEIVNSGNITVLWQGTTIVANGPPSGFQFGAGVRCVGGNLLRLYKGNASGGSIGFPNASGPDVHTASAAKGYAIVPPITLHYFAAYRNSAAGGPCGSASLGYNATNAGSIAWTP